MEAVPVLLLPYARSTKAPAWRMHLYVPSGWSGSEGGAIHMLARGPRDCQRCRRELTMLNDGRALRRHRGPTLVLLRVSPVVLLHATPAAATPTRVGSPSATATSSALPS
jgi:hypothetical protein